MKGHQIVALILEWATKERMHQDDFDNLFVPELLEKMEEDK